MRKVLLAAVAAALAPASAAEAAEAAEIGCVAQRYSPDQQSELDALLPAVDALGGGSMEALGALIGGAATQCASTHGWDALQFELALLNELGRLLELAMRRHGPLSSEEIARLDAALAQGDRTALWAALEEQMAAGFSGSDAETNDGGAMLFGSFMLETGIGLDNAKAEQVGAFLAAMAMQRVSARRFAQQ
jgi:hypothetical protein